MADKKDLSIDDIMAMARGKKAAPATGPAAGGESPPEPAAEKPAAPAKKPAAEGKPAKPSGGAKPGGGKPGGGMSLDDILAAARGKPGDAPKAAAPAKPAAEAAPTPKPKVEPKKPVAKAEATEKKSDAPAIDTSSILAMARGSRPGPMSKAEAAEKAKGEAGSGKSKPVVPPMPEKPAYAQAVAAPVAADDDETRRGFFATVSAALVGSYMAVGFSTLAITNLLWTLGMARFMFPNILTEPPMKFKVGTKDEYGPGQVETKYIAQYGVWVVRTDYEGRQMIFALKTVCTHLGCTPNWLEGEQKFKCPCHGSGFYKDGVNFEGPAPRPLERYAIKEVNGQLEVDKSRTFLEEKGGWVDVDSFVLA